MAATLVQSPPVHAGPRPSSRAPAHEGAFFGREKALERLAGLFDSGARLVVLVGLGGIGKTRLAVEYLGAGAARWPGGRWVCDLSSAGSLGELCEVVARVLGAEIGSEGARDALDWLGAALAARPGALLLLDNFEQLTDHARSLDALLDAAPELSILVTSRARLRLGREHLLELQPLALPSDEQPSSPATELFIDRARRVRGDYAPGAADARAIAHIVRELDGIPLSIELVAAWTQLLGPEQILSRIREHSELAVTLDVDRAPRHASLRNALEWSWSLLEPVEQRALAELAVFSGGFDVELASEVLELDAAGTTVLDALQRLRDNSLVRVVGDADGELRLGMYGAVSDLASEKLDASGRRGQAEARHARAVLARSIELAEKLHGPDGVLCFAKLEREFENLLAVFERALGARPPSEENVRAALAAAAVMNDVTSRRGPIAEHLGRLDRAIELARATIPADDELVSALLARGASLSASGEGDRAILDHREAARIARSLANPALEIECWVNVVFSLHGAGRLDEAVALWDRTLSPVIDALPSRWRGLVGGVRGILYVEQGEYTRGERLLREALTSLPETGDARHAGLGRVSLGDATRATGRTDDARRHYESGLALVRQVRDGHHECTSLLALGALHHEIGELGSARERYHEALAVALRLGARQKETLARAAIAALHADADRLELAEDALALATRLGQSLRFSWLAVIIALAEGHVTLARTRSAGRGLESPAESAGRGRAGALLEQAAGSEAFRTSEAVRSAARLLAAALERAPAARDSSPTRAIALPVSRPDVAAADDGALVVCRAENWFRPPFGERVGLQRHRSLALLLWELVQQRLAAPGVPLDLDRLFSVGWPGQHVLHDAATMRVYRAIATLRRRGLRTILLSVGGGYLLDARVPIVDHH